MNDNAQNPRGNESMEERLWQYIDGLSSQEEQSAIHSLIEANVQWKQKYHELLEIQRLIKSSDLEEPSLRFTKNVMEEIARYQITPAAKTYIDKKIIWGIGTFFLVMIFGFLIYGFAQIDWTASGDSKLPVDLSKLDFSKIFNNTYVNVFMMINVVLGLMLLDRYLSSRKKDRLREV